MYTKDMGVKNVDFGTDEIKNIMGLREKIVSEIEKDITSQKI